MARTDTLGNFLTDVAEAIRTKKGTTDAIAASNFDTEIESIESGGEQFKPKFISFYKYDGEDLTYETKSIDTSEMTSALNMFCYDEKLKNVDLSEWNTENITNFESMFAYCRVIEEIKGIENIIVTSKATTLDRMFYFCEKLKSIDTSKWDTSNVTNMGYLFANCKALQYVDTSNWDTSNVEKFVNGYSASVFYNCNNLEEVDVSNWDISKATDFREMFKNCNKLKTIDMSKWKTEKPTGIQDMFSYCNKLEYADISWYITEGNTTQLTNVFQYCSSLKRVKIFPYTSRRSSANSAQYMFQNCLELEEIDLSSWTTNDFGNMRSLFSGCRNIKRIDMRNLETDRLTNINSMFNGCESLEYLDIRNFTFDAVTDSTFLFNKVPDECEIIVKSDTEKQWILDKWWGLTNIKTVAEFEAGEA